MNHAHPIELLLVEDSPGDVDLIKKALQRGKIANSLTVAKDGVEALAVLRRVGQHAQSPRPELVLLDLNLPKKDGREVLAEIKQDPQLRSIPVIVLTSSQAEEDILKSYDLHASGFITKPVDLDEFVRVVRAIDEFWFHVVRLPGVD